MGIDTSSATDDVAHRGRREATQLSFYKVFCDLRVILRKVKYVFRGISNYIRKSGAITVVIVNQLA